MKALPLLLLACAVPSLAQAPLSPRKTCSSLKGFLVLPADIGLETTGAVVNSARLKRSGLTEFCKVLGEIRPVTPTADSIQFEINLPTQWNGKAVHFGGGSFDGTLSLSNGLSSPTLSIKHDPTPLQRGFATFGSDSGHHHPYLLLPDVTNALRARFALNPEERVNYAHDALKKTHDVAAKIIQKRYGSPARHMYFLGGSTGGREAYFVTQLWPNDYDGVLGAFAGWNQVELDLKFLSIAEAQYSKGGALPGSKTRLVASKVMEACDAQDGLKDGIISNPSVCRFDLKQLACPPGEHKRSCLSPGQLHTFEVFASEQRTAQPLAHGVQSIPGYNITSGTDLTGSMGLLRFPLRPPVFLLNSFYWVVADGVVRYFLTENPHVNALKLDPVTGGLYSARLLPQSLASDASDADLTPFERHGGKFLIVHGTSDSVIPTNASVEFYQMMQANMSQAEMDHFVRLYLIPGFSHDRGVFNAGFDGLGILDRWVEEGQPPTGAIVTDNNKSAHGRTRPLCAYPTWPRYSAGDPKQAASFTCSQ